MSRVVITEHATIYEGPDAVKLRRAQTVKTGLKLAQVGIRINYRVSPQRLLLAAGTITGKTYGRRAYAVAIADLEQWIAAMMAAIPIVKE
jgi:hypothetical protein